LFDPLMPKKFHQFGHLFEGSQHMLIMDCSWPAVKLLITATA
jgi:hypothetical protein